MFNMNNFKTVKRGAILRCTSGKHRGDYYMLVRTMGGHDKNTDFLGNTLPKTSEMRYTYNLVNLTGEGKTRQTEVERAFVSDADGVAVGVNLHRLEQHFGMSLEDVTDVACIKVEVKELLDEKLGEKRTVEAVATVLDMAQVFFGPNTTSLVPVYSGNKVVAYRIG